MRFEPRDYFRHILAEADYLINQSAGLTADKLMADDTLRRAFVGSLEITTAMRLYWREGKHYAVDSRVIISRSREDRIDSLSGVGTRSGAVRTNS
jgi:hypothetical protein